MVIYKTAVRTACSVHVIYGNTKHKFISVFTTNFVIA